MIPNNIKDLIKALIAKTASKKAIWGKTSRPNEFKLSLEKGAVTTDCWNENGTESVDFGIYNVYGDRIDNFLAEKGDADYDLLVELHNSAKREFYKVDDTISHLFNEINDSKSVGKREIEGKEDLPF